MVIHKQDYLDQYEQELRYQEINSNKRTLKGFIWFLTALAFVWFLTMIDFFNVNKTMVTIAFFVTVVLLTPSLFFLRKGDLSNPKLKYIFLSLVCIAVTIIISILSFHAILLYVIPLIYSIQYRKRRVIWFTYVINTLNVFVSSLASFYYGLCDLNLLFESQHIRDFYLANIENGVLYIPFNDNPTFIIIVFAVFPRSIILLIFTIMLRYSIVSSGEDAVRIAKLTYFNETDTRTGVYNKNKYEEMINEYYPTIDKVTVLFWDLNELKRINDKYGHAMGDRAISVLSSALHTYANHTNCRVYRVGGDEFVMIIDNPKNNVAKSIISDVTARLKKSNEKETIPISCAVGYATGKGKDILKVVANADARMYENKKSGKEGHEA